MGVRRVIKELREVDEKVRIGLAPAPTTMKTKICDLLVGSKVEG